MLLSLGCISYVSVVALAKHGRFVDVVFELEKVAGRVLQKKCPMLDARAGKAAAWLLKELQALGLRPIAQCLPVRL